MLETANPLYIAYLRYLDTLPYLTVPYLTLPSVARLTLALPPQDALHCLVPTYLPVVRAEVALAARVPVPLFVRSLRLLQAEVGPSPSRPREMIGLSPSCTSTYLKLQLVHVASPPVFLATHQVPGCTLAWPSSFLLSALGNIPRSQATPGDSTHLQRQRQRQRQPATRNLTWLHQIEPVQPSPSPAQSTSRSALHRDDPPSSLSTYSFPISNWFPAHICPSGCPIQSTSFIRASPSSLDRHRLRYIVSPAFLAPILWSSKTFLSLCRCRLTVLGSGSPDSDRARFCFCSRPAPMQGINAGCSMLHPM